MLGISNYFNSGIDDVADEGRNREVLSAVKLSTGSESLANRNSVPAESTLLVPLSVPGKHRGSKKVRPKLSVGKNVPTDPVAEGSAPAADSGSVLTLDDTETVREKKGVKHSKSKRLQGKSEFDLF